MTRNPAGRKAMKLFWKVLRVKVLQKGNKCS